MQIILAVQRFGKICSNRAVTRPLARASELLIRLVWGAYLPSDAQIHPSVHFGHNGMGVIVNRSSVIAADCHIAAHVVLGGNTPSIGAPILEQSVAVYVGAKVLGPITIGQHSVIGANAVVTKDIPPYSLVLGVPGKVVRSVEPRKSG